MFWIPAVGEKCLIQNLNGVRRAVRVLTVENPKDYITFYLLDTGENSIYPIKYYPVLYEMSKSIAEIPGLAIKCSEEENSSVSSSEDFSDNSERRNLEALVDIKVTIEVIDVLQDKLIVKLFPYEDSPSKTHQLSTENICLNLDPPCQEQPLDTNFMTEQEKELLNVDLNTSDAEVAVYGFKPSNEEARLCKFYDPKIGGCFKGGRCKFRHQLRVEEDLLDTQTIWFDNIPKRIPIPELHSTVKIDVTHFLDVNRFYCVYKNPSEDRKVEDLLRTMNKKELVACYKQITLPPSEKQLVIVKVRGKFYRGRVEDVEDSNVEIFTVLLVDFGNVVELNKFNHMYEWVTCFDDVPFRTVEMIIANIKPISKELSYEGVEYLDKTLTDSKDQLHAVVFNNLVDIECRLALGDLDLGEELVDRGLAATKKVFSPETAKDLCFPG